MYFTMYTKKNVQVQNTPGTEQSKADSLINIFSN